MAQSAFAFFNIIGIRGKPERPGSRETQRGGFCQAGLCKQDALFFSFFSGGANAERSACFFCLAQTITSPTSIRPAVSMAYTVYFVGGSSGAVRVPR